MSLTLNNTPGDAGQNSFADVDYFKSYRESRLPAVAAVTAASDDQITAALIVGCRYLCVNFDWTGAAVDDVQALPWPRKGMATRNGFPIPESGASSIQPDLKNAQCEYAFQLLAGANFSSDNAAAQLGVSGVKAGSVAVNFQSVDTSTEESVDIFIRRMGSEFNYVSTAVPGEVRRLLVPSWFNQPSIVRPIDFGAM